MGEKVISVRVPKEIAQKVREKAKGEDLTVSQIVRRSLRRYLQGDCKDSDDSSEEGD